MTRQLLANLLGAVFAAALTACGGNDDPPPANSVPLAAFDSPAAAAAGDALAFDASTSSDADGDALTFSWDFGDGTHGGGAELAHVFSSEGSFTVTLTVADALGASASATREITVSAGPPMLASASSVAVVSDAAGPLGGVSVAVLGTQETATTGADGKADIDIATGPQVTLKFGKPGYADQWKRVQLHAGASGTQLAVRMLAREGALTLSDAAAGGTLAGKDGATLVAPAGALVDAAGNPVSGMVQVSLTPVDVAADVRAFPGLFQGLQPSGSRGLIESYGAVEFIPTQSGAPVQVAAGRTVTIEIPIYTALHRDGSAVAAGQEVPLWSLDERTASWVQEGVGTVVDNAASPTGFALRADVGHLSWWNCDQWLGSIPDDSYNPDVSCCIRDVPNGPCKENSGDICEHTGSGPLDLRQSSAALRRALGQGPRPQASEAPRVPAVAAFATAPAIGGAVLPMPADMDITLESTARNGTYRGVTVLRGGAGVSEDVTVTVLPVASGGGDEAITLPWSQDYAAQSNGEVHRYKLALPVGTGFELTVAQSGSTLGGTLTITRPDGSVVASQNFGAEAAYIAEASVATAGDYIIEITAGSNAPGAYRLEAVSFGSCATTEALTLPFNDTLELGPKQSRCLDVALGVDEVIEIELLQAHNQVAGSISLATAGGAQVLSARSYPVDVAPILSGVSVAGTYRVRVTNTTLNSGMVELGIAKPQAQVLQVPGSVTLTDMGPNAPEQLFVLEPPADGLLHVMLAATNLEAGVLVEPAGPSFLVGCTSCSSQNTSTDARALRSTAPALPVARVFRNSGSGNTVVLSTGVPILIGRDTDIAGASASGLQVHAFDGDAGEEVSFGFAQPEASTDFSSLAVYLPSGATAGGNNTAHSLAESGLYTALVSTFGASTGAYTLRVNNVPAVQALPLSGALTEQAIDLALGQVYRYTVLLAAGDLVGLNLDTTEPLFVSAALSGVDDGVATTPSSGSGPFSVASLPLFVGSGGSSTLTLRAQGQVLERVRGPLTLGVVHPDPAAASFNIAQTGTLDPFEWTTFGYDVPASGRYLLRIATPTSAPYALAATVWASSAPVSNYTGEFTSSVSSSFVPTESIGLLDAGGYTVSVRNGEAQQAAQFEMALVDLEPPAALVAGGPALAGEIDTAGERDFASFTATANQAFTLRATPTFNGMLRVRKLSPDGDWSLRDQVFQTFTIPGTPLAVTAGQEKVFSFTIPATATLGDGSYIVELAADGPATGTYTMQLTSP